MTENKNVTPDHEQELGSAQIVKLAIDLGPLVAFFAAYSLYGILPATAVLMAATVASVIASRVFLGHVATMPVVTAVLVLVFGSLTLWLADPTFIKMKPTILYVLFAAVLGGGLLTGKLLLKHVFGEAFNITDEGWAKLTVRWITFCLVLAILNEVVWRTMSEEAWVQFKVFGILPLTLIFGLMQVSLLKKYAVQAP